MGDGLLRVVLIGETTGKEDFPRHPVAFGESIDVLAWLGRSHVVHTQVQRRAHLELGQHANGGDAARGIHQGGDGAPVDHAGFRVADDRFAIRQA
ncbi:hypothetical protein FQZ97_951830 [compost metagenome]